MTERRWPLVVADRGLREQALDPAQERTGPGPQARHLRTGAGRLPRPHRPPEGRAQAPGAAASPK